MGWAERANPKSLRNLSLAEQSEALAKKEKRRKQQQARTEMIGKLRRRMFVRRAMEQAAKEEESLDQDHRPTTQGGADGR